MGQTAGNNATGDRCFLALDDAGLGSTINDLIIFGDHAGDAGLTDIDLAGSIVIGNGSAGALTQAVPNDSKYQKPNLIVGFNAAAACVSAGGNVVLGHGAVNAYVGAGVAAGTLEAFVAIGQDACGAMNPTVGLDGTPRTSVVIGARAAFGGGGARFSILSSVVIGNEACEDTGGAGSSNLIDDVVIGYRAGRALGQGSLDGTQTVIIGANACTAQNNIRECVAIGNNTSLTTGPAPSSNPPRSSIVIGNGTNAAGQRNTLVGAGASCLGDSNILVGYLANTNVSSPFSDFLLIGTSTHRVVYSDMAAGNILLGDSIAGGAILNFGTGAPTNVLKLLNGTPATSNPSGGGYLYCAAAANAALHWVQSDGTDTVLAGGGGGALLGRGTFTAAAGANNNVTPDLAVNIQSINRLFVDTAAGAANITGISAGYNGQMLWVNVSGGNPLTLNSENAGSTAANRLSGSSDLVFASGDNTLLVYDDTIDRWMMGV